MAPTFDLLIITDGLPDLVARVERALSQALPGRVAIVLREPGCSTSALLELAGPLRSLTRAASASLLIHDRVDVALAIEADGVHLPEAGFTPTQARRLLGPHGLVGVSRHSAEGLASASRQGADYATLSPVHAVAGKAPALGIDGFASRCASAGTLPVYALGGIGQDDVSALRAAGARGVAVMRAVLSAADPGASARRFLERLHSP